MSNVTNTLLQVKDLSFSYDPENWILKNVSFELNAGEILTILGPNGAGKSTLLNCICRLQRGGTGTILINGMDVRRFTSRSFARHVAYVSQNQTKVYDFTVREFVAMGRAPYIGITQSPSERDYQTVDAVLNQMGLTEIAEKSYTRISGGECQRAMIARAIVQEADLIVFDEPTNHLDYGNQIKVLRQIMSLSERGFAVLWTTHMPDHALMLDGNVAVIDRGGTMSVGSAKSLLTQERLTKLYATPICKTYVEPAGRDACLPYRLDQFLPCQSKKR